MAELDAISLLREDHHRVEALLQQLTVTSERATRTRAQLRRRLRRMIHIHARLEMEIFYPAFREVVSSKSKARRVRAAEDELQRIERELEELLRADPSTEAFAEKARRLEALLKEHAEQEEEHMFKEARELRSQTELERLGDRISERKRQMEGASANGRATEAAS